MNTVSCIRLGRFEVRPAQRLLLQDGCPCRIGGRAFDVLLVLLEEHHRVVTRAELIERVWPGLAIEPNNLQVQIWTLRKLLGRRAIINVPRRGYRYVGPLAEAVGLAPRPRFVAQARSEASQSPPSSHGASQRTLLRWHSRDD